MTTSHRRLNRRLLETNDGGKDRGAAAAHLNLCLPYRAPTTLISLHSREKCPVLRPPFVYHNGGCHLVAASIA